MAGISDNHNNCALHRGIDGEFQAIRAAIANPVKSLRSE
jgi:hypothetical protein